MKNILLVEDDDSIAYPLKEALEKRDYHVFLAALKSEALQYLNSYIDLII